ncbi:MAG: alpha-amylase family glycosyl hydrolase, partial [Bacteroidetes bacterium]|nr:alpha-amylase family glycosyl hydrolase [Bacteroidota bacterium]
MKLNRLLCMLFLGVLSTPLTIDAQRNDRVVLQAFYWDYYNEGYPQGWANYITELAPRLREMGIDAVWVPPSFKNANPNSVGYSPFDHYDLGDKFQKGDLKTPLGDKDEFLRMVAVLHTNGIEVIQDITLNHVSDAG